MKRFVSLVLFLVLYVVVRIGGITSSYYQDELDWVLEIAQGNKPAPHPPFSTLFYRIGESVFGEVLLRLVPFLLGAAVLILLWLVMRRRFGVRAAHWAVGFFSVSFYGVLASLMIDTDGQFLPFFFLGALYSLDRWGSATGRAKLLWALSGTMAILLGMGTKLSFSVAVGALAFEYIFSHWEYRRSMKFWAKLAAYGLGICASVALIIVFGRFFVSGYSAHTFLSYTERFFTLDRGWIQIIIQTVKSLLYLSPALVLLPFTLRKERLSRLRPFLLYVVLGLVFYLVLFDFSAAALDRYLMFLVVPVSAMAGVAASDAFSEKKVSVRALWGVALVLVLLAAIPFLGHHVPPHYPKQAWFSWVLQGKWMFLLPFTGGSGPLGFYVSWMFIGMSWLLSVVVLAAYYARRLGLQIVALLIVGISLIYNGIFLEEYLFGRIHGSAQRLMRQAIEYIAKTPDVQRVITYNDIGGYELIQIGKYERRLYAAPKFEDAYRDIFAAYRGHILLIDIPHINEDSPYRRYFAGCRSDWQARDGVIAATIMYCTPHP